MPITFLEPGSNATYDLSLWGSDLGSVWSTTDHPRHGARSLRLDNAGGILSTPMGILANQGRCSWFVYLESYPSAAVDLLLTRDTGTFDVFKLKLTPAGVPQLHASSQMGSDGSVSVPLNAWTQISLGWTLTSTSINEFYVWVGGSESLHVVNGSMDRIDPSQAALSAMEEGTGGTFIADVWVDTDASLTYPGAVMVTAKRPMANNDTWSSATQIGAGGSGEGTGHAPQINERPLSVSNGWSTTLTGANESYEVEGAAAGDVDISLATYLGYMAWIRADAAAGGAASIIAGGASTGITLTTSPATYRKAVTTASYPASGAVVGLASRSTADTTRLYEAGIAVAYLEPSADSQTWLRHRA